GPRRPAPAPAPRCRAAQPLHRLRHFPQRRPRRLRPRLPVHPPRLCRAGGPRPRPPARPGPAGRAAFRPLPPHASRQPRSGAAWRAMDRHHHPHGGAVAGGRCRRRRPHHGPRPGGSLAPRPGTGHPAGGHGGMPRHADGLCPAPRPAGAGPRRRPQAPRRHWHSLPGLCPARPGGGARLREALRHRHALLGQHDDRALPPIPRPAGRGPGDRHLPGIPRRLPCRAALRRWPGEGDPLPPAPALPPARRLLPPHLPELRRLCQCPGRRDRRLHGRPGRAVAPGPQCPRRGTGRAARRGAAAGRAGERRAPPGRGARLPRQSGAGGGRPAATPDARLVAPGDGLADAADRPTRPGIRPRPAGDESAGDGAASPPRGPGADEIHDPSACLGAGRPLRPCPSPGREAGDSGRRV
ncbi:MAG: Coenzyme F420-reducing hydrogenase related protein, partial [uncultured Craurococcus sp.]